MERCFLLVVVLKSDETGLTLSSLLTELLPLLPPSAVSQVNIIPVIAKADTFTAEECAKFKTMVSCVRACVQRCAYLARHVTNLLLLTPRLRAVCDLGKAVSDAC